MTANISRRDLFKLGGVAAASVAGASALAGCASPKSTSSKSSSAAASDGTPSFFQAPDPIKDVKETKDYDVVIVGAGASGVPAAISAAQAGARVALIQKESTAISQGNTATGILLDQSDPAGVEAVVSTLLGKHEYRGKREQVEL